MRALVSPVTEYQLHGIAQIAGGLGIAIVAAVTAGVGSVVLLLATALLAGPLMYVLVYRRFARAAVKEPPPAPSDEHEPLVSTRLRVARIEAVLIVFLAAFALLTDAAPVAGILLGNGAAVVATARWLRRWQRAHNATVLREPRWRFNREGRRGQARGRGIMDPQDFYVVTSRAPHDSGRAA